VHAPNQVLYYYKGFDWFLTLAGLPELKQVLTPRTTGFEVSGYFDLHVMYSEPV